MRILFVVGHPAHVHLFRNSIAELGLRGHRVDVAAVDKESTLQLLAAYNIDFHIVGRNVSSIGWKLLDTPSKDIRLVRLLKDADTEVVVSTGSPYAAQASAMRGIPHIAFSDTEIAVAVLRLMLPFTDAICTPAAFQKDLGSKQVRYDGYKELAYLHPARFTPQPGILDLVDATPTERIIVVRFASWDSSHDGSTSGRALHGGSEMVTFVRNLEQLGRVFVTSERRVPAELADLELKIPLERIHDLLFFSTLYIGEGATMASEAGVLGTPWIFLSTEGRGYLDDQAENYGLGFWVTTAEAALARARTLLADPNLKMSWASKRAALLRDKIDVTDFIVRFIERWPESFGRPAARIPSGLREAAK